jgi:hypothetical protein
VREDFTLVPVNLLSVCGIGEMTPPPDLPVVAVEMIAVEVREKDADALINTVLQQLPDDLWRGRRRRGVVAVVTRPVRVPLYVCVCSSQCAENGERERRTENVHVLLVHKE